MESIKILYIDDISSNFGTLVDALKNYFNIIPSEPIEEDIAQKTVFEKNELYCVENSKQALMLIQEHCFDIAFVDYLLINETGDNVGKKISEEHLAKHGKKLHQVMLTGNSVHRKAIQAGVFFDYIKKPLTKEQLDETMYIFESFYKEIERVRKEREDEVIKRFIRNWEHIIGNFGVDALYEHYNKIKQKIKDIVQYNNRVLIIGENSNETEKEIVNPLRNMGLMVDILSNPGSGLELASHKYSLIFIDFEFTKFPRISGLNLCEKINTMYPLSTLILLISHQDICFVNGHWHGLFPKNTHKASQLEEYINNIILLRYERENVWKKIEEIDTNPKLSQFEQELDEIEEILNKDPRNNTVAWLAQSLFYKKAENRLKTINKFEEDKINNVISYHNKIWDWTTDKKINDKDLLRKIKMELSGESMSVNNIFEIIKDINDNTKMDRVILTQRFQCEEKGVISNNSLIMRHLIKNHPNKWRLTRETLKPLKKLITYFSVD